MRLPKRVKIGALPVKVVYQEGMGATYGLFDPTELQIEINPNYTSKSQQASTLLHEILHVIFYNSGINNMIKNDKLEEQVVRALEAHLYSFIVDNPSVIRFLQRSNKE